MKKLFCLLILMGGCKTSMTDDGRLDVRLEPGSQETVFEDGSAASSSGITLKFIYTLPYQGKEPSHAIRYEPNATGTGAAFVGLAASSVGAQLLQFGPDKPAYKNAGKGLAALGAAGLGVALIEYAVDRQEDALAPLLPYYYERMIQKGWNQLPD